MKKFKVKSNPRPFQNYVDMKSKGNKFLDEMEDE
jgi:hypothetical protein